MDPRRAPTEPYSWWGYHWHAPEPRSIAALIAAGTLDAGTAALLWLALERRASLVVAARAPHAGKTTVLTALLDFLPADTTRYYLRGWSETFDFLDHADPRRGYILCNEISAHLPVYLWGRKVSQLFAAAARGYKLGTTMHAESVEELVATLADDPLYVPRAASACLDLLLILDVDYDPATRQARRRLRSLHLLRRDGVGDDVDPVTLAWWDTGRAAVVHDAGALPPGLLRLTGRTAAEFAAVCQRRAAFLAELVARGVLAVPDVRRALAAYATPVPG